jgi:hypothetical protein
VLTFKFDIMKKTECPVSQIGTSDFYNDKMVNIFKWRSNLYISQVELCIHVFQVMHIFFE